MTTRCVMIYVVDANNFTVVEGENYADSLCWDEMLGCIAEATHDSLRAIRTPRYMKTPQEHERWNDRHVRRPRCHDCLAPRGESHAFGCVHSMLPSPENISESE